MPRAAAFFSRLSSTSCSTEALSRYTERVQELDPELRPEERDEKAPHGTADRSDPREKRREQARRERQVCVFCTERFQTISSVQESKDLTNSRMPAIVISSSGMATGGRVLHHLKAALPDPRNSVLLVGRPNLKLFRNHDNLVVKLLYWPVITSVMLVITLLTFCS